MLKSRIEALDDFALVDESPATTYPEALAAFAGGQIDVVLLDINIPMWTATAPSHDDGVRLGELIADKFPATVIVVCTGNSHRDAITRCRPFSSVILEKQMIWQEDADLLEVALKAALSGQQL